MEQMLFHLINQEWIHPSLDRMMTVLSDFSVWKPVLGLVSVIILIAGGTRGRIGIVLAILLVLLNDNAISYPLKRITGRARPYESTANVRTLHLNHSEGWVNAITAPPLVKTSPQPDASHPPRGRSFPSSHTFNMVALAWFAYRFAPRIGRWMLVIPLLMAWSRIYTGSHWPADVLFPLIAGPLLNEVLLRYLNRLWSRVMPRLAPSVFTKSPTLLPPSPTPASSQV